MAFLPGDPDKDKVDAQGQPVQGNETVLSGETASNAGGAAGSAPTTGTTQTASKSGSFTNLNNYLDTNKEQSGAMGGAVKSNVDTEAGKTNEAVGNFTGETNRLVQANTVKAPDVIQAMGGKPDYYNKHTQVAQNDNEPTIGDESWSSSSTTPRSDATPAPTSGTFSTFGAGNTNGEPFTGSESSFVSTSGQNLNNVNGDDFAKAYNAQWNGPANHSEVASFAPAQEAVGKLGDKVKASGNWDGLKGLLGETYGKNADGTGKQYSAGEKNLDTFITGSGEQGRAAIDSIGKQYGNYDTGFAQDVANADDAITTGQRTTGITRGAVRDLAASAENKYTGVLDAARNQAAAGNDTMKQEYTQVHDTLSSPDPAVRAQGFAKLGFDPSIGEMLMKRGLKPADLISMGQARNEGDVLGADDRSQINALQGLMSKADPAQQLFTGYNMQGTGNTGANDFSNDRINAIKDASRLGGNGILATLQSKIATQNANRDSTFNEVQRALRNADNPENQAFLHSQGIDLDPTQVMAARAGTIGVDPSSFLNKSTEQYGFGDVANDQDRAQWGSLANLLGLDPNALAPHTAGGPVSFDSAAFQKAIAGSPAAQQYIQDQQEVAARAAEAAAEAQLNTGDPEGSTGTSVPQAMGDTASGVYDQTFGKMYNYFANKKPSVL